MALGKRIFVNYQIKINLIHKIKKTIIFLIFDSSLKKKDDSSLSKNRKTQMKVILPDFAAIVSTQQDVHMNRLSENYK